MLTYQDFLAAKDVAAFLEAAVQEHQASELYQTAMAAREYDKQRNPTIEAYQKLLYTLSGVAVPDNYSANHKIASGFFPFFVTQQNQYLLGNGVALSVPENKAKLGKGFDVQLQKLGREALVCGVSFGFWDHDHLEGFGLGEFVPLWDELSGKLMAGIRYYQIDEDKPMQMTLYLPEGFVSYMREDGEIRMTKGLQAYRQIVRVSQVDGEEMLGGENYPVLPIVPLWGNPHHQSEIVGIRSQIDAYDLIKSGFANDLDDASMIYWTITNTCGMDDIDLAKFLEHMKTVRAAVVDGDSGVKAEAHTLEVPYAGRIAYLERLEKDLYQDYQALNVAALSSGNKTATEIWAAYQPMDNKADQFEYEVLEFLEEIFLLAGVEDTPGFVRSRIVNRKEEVEMILAAGEVLGVEETARRVRGLLGE